jgi:HSP20 family molecular chaperone IbpA
VWLICRAASGRGKNKLLVRGVKGVEWVFCPLIKGIQDRISTEQCQKCKYFIRFEETYTPQTRSTKRTFFLGITQSKASFHITRSHSRPRITHPHVALFPHIPTLINEREPLVDIFEENNHLIVLAELPGIDEKDLKIKVNENTVTITAENAKKKYLKIVRLPTRVNKDAIEYTYRNNILQVRLEKL